MTCSIISLLMQMPQTQVSGKKGLAIQKTNKTSAVFRQRKILKLLIFFCQSICELLARIRENSSSKSMYKLLSEFPHACIWHWSLQGLDFQMTFALTYLMQGFCSQENTPIQTHLVENVHIRYLYKCWETELEAQNLMQILVEMFKREFSFIICFPLDESYLKHH